MAPTISSGAALLTIKEEDRRVGNGGTHHRQPPLLSIGQALDSDATGQQATNTALELIRQASFL